MCTKICQCKDHIGDPLVSLDLFYKKKNRKDGLDYYCKVCRNKLNKQYNEANRNSLLSYKNSYRNQNREYLLECSKLWAKENQDKVNESSAKYRKNNPDKRKESTRRWRQNNKGLVTYHANKRRKVIKMSTPKWVKDEDIKYFFQEAFYLTSLSNEIYHVHHIIPLQGDPTVCGLNCPENLIVLSENEHKMLHSNLEFIRLTYTKPLK